MEIKSPLSVVDSHPTRTGRSGYKGEVVVSFPIPIASSYNNINIHTMIRSDSRVFKHEWSE